ncbi:flavodoxin [Streptomyces sp. WAC05374]|uniref:flavodoxin domain-containing protein n=1 Tax=Streptomyces sp. WAC05374 TaxID=2487420 RepID=UPI000F894EA5|nr:flavodoxin domain-containing protein [Streptomyces sp. WAC05374]RST17645.1 flavodoxin [Streptomyces sp. WAC05374]TDF54780.1 flavodoxin [Streptomyces sp. WAC05374]TDF56416.1 flavodoxin [Streptomyces sp. WAC05374]
MPGKVLVTYGTTNGSTAEIAGLIASVLRDEGLEAEARTPSEVTDVAPYGAVVIGGALSMGRWHRDARRFARRHRRALRERPVWLFSSGPLDPSASEREIPPVPGARRAQRRTDARDHVTFGGRLEAGAKGRMARAILDEDRGGDFRDLPRIAGWAAGVAAEIRAAEGS